MKLRKAVEDRLNAWGCRCIELSEAHAEQDRHANRVCNLLQYLGATLNVLSSLAGGRWLAHLHELKRGASEPLFSLGGLDHYPRGHVQQLVQQAIDWGREAERRGA